MNTGAAAQRHADAADPELGRQAIRFENEDIGQAGKHGGNRRQVG